MPAESPLRVILMPGLDGTGKLFAPAVAACLPGFTPHVIRYPCDAAPSIDALVEQASRDITASASTDAPTLLVAESFSGPIAVRVAAREPDCCIAVVLVASFVTPPVRSWAKAAPLGLLAQMPIPTWAARRFACGRDATDDQIAAFRHAIDQLPPRVVAQRLRQVLRTDARNELQRLTMPLLYLQASHDRLVPPRAAREVIRLCPSTTLATIAGPHLLMQTRPAACWRAIETFVAQRLSPIASK